MDRAEEEWYNRGIATLSLSERGGPSCWQHPHGTGTSSSRSVRTTEIDSPTPIRAIRLPTIEFIPLSVWYAVPLRRRYRDRRYNPWQVYRRGARPPSNIGQHPIG